MIKNEIINQHSTIYLSKNEGLTIKRLITHGIHHQIHNQIQNFKFFNKKKKMETSKKLNYNNLFP